MTTLITYGTNLLPRHVVDARRARNRRRLWAGTLCVGASLSGLAVVMPSDVAESRTALRLTRDTLAADIERLRGLVEQEAATAQRLNRDVAVRAGSSSRLDWSGLVIAVAEAAEGRARLDAMAVTPLSADSGGATRFQINLSGEVATLTDASAFVLALEDVPVFSRIELVSTSQASGNAAAATFAVSGEVAMLAREQQTDAGDTR